MDIKKACSELSHEWKTNPRWKGIKRPYQADDVIKLRGSLQIEYTIAKLGAEKLWNLFENEAYVRALGALTGNQAVQQVSAGLKAIYVSGWQVAADNNDALQTYPDQSLYPVLSVPQMIKRINNALQRADQIDHMNNKRNINWFAPIIADAEAGFGGTLNTFELVKAMIEAGAAAIHLEDQLASLKKCGHLGGKVLIPTQEFIQKLVAARLAMDVLGIPTLLIARTDAHSASLIHSADDPRDAPFLTGEKTADGYHCIRGGIEYAIERGKAFAPYSDLVWCETSTPDLKEAKAFAEAIHKEFPGKWLAYNCSPSFNWSSHLNKEEIAKFQEELGEMGYKFQFVTLAGFHTLNASMFELAHHYSTKGMSAYAEFQDHEFALEKECGYKAVKHQQFVGTGYFDLLSTIINDGECSTTALKGSTEEQQFQCKL